MSVAATGIMSSLDGAFLQVPAAETPMPAAVLGGTGLLGLLAAGKLRRRTAGDTLLISGNAVLNQSTRAG